jgi:inner membrane protein involved in colicin E2 resistance
LFLDTRLVEITMIFHVLKDRESYREEMLRNTGSAAANWASAVKKMRDNIIVCNYKFLRDMSKNAKDDSWIISGLNHWLPSEYEQQPQQ